MTAISRAARVGLAGVLVIGNPPAAAQSGPVPKTFVYQRVGAQDLAAHVFLPRGYSAARPANAVLLFHGGGWSAGEPAWTFEVARRFAAWGLVAIAIQYRLSLGTVTPIDAFADVCAAVRWARSTEMVRLGPRLAGYGISAGGQLAAAVGTIGCPDQSASFDAVLLLSPAVDLARDQWFERLLQGRARSRDYSPVEHVRRTSPPTSIVHGEDDTLTPIAGARRFCRALVSLGQRCELHAFPRLGHLLTRNLAEQEQAFDPDPQAQAAGLERQRRFLESLGFMP